MRICKVLKRKIGRTTGYATSALLWLQGINNAVIQLTNLRRRISLDGFSDLLVAVDFMQESTLTDMHPLLGSDDFKTQTLLLH
jgi:hypothetical protein